LEKLLARNSVSQNEPWVTTLAHNAGMSFKLSLVSLVYPNAETDSEFKPELLRKANAWLQRRNASISDDLLLIGVGFMMNPPSGQC
jgi:hypothetical protein